ncbi:hypothetical protein C8J57DRAFT_1705909 [Mycena rebaudengoi]|nr:hypothetical protein C8J57DRAFT_1705909 [Mycena rebaudengoi]
MAATNKALLASCHHPRRYAPLVAHRHRAFAHNLVGQHKPEARGTRQAAKEARSVRKPPRGERKSGPHWCACYEAGESGQGREVPAMAGAPLRERRLVNFARMLMGALWPRTLRMSILYTVRTTYSLNLMLFFAA